MKVHLVREALRNAMLWLGFGVRGKRGIRRRRRVVVVYRVLIGVGVIASVIAVT